VVRARGDLPVWRGEAEGCPMALRFTSRGLERVQAERGELGPNPLDYRPCHFRRTLRAREGRVDAMFASTSREIDAFKSRPAGKRTVSTPSRMRSLTAGPILAQRGDMVRRRRGATRSECRERSLPPERWLPRAANQTIADVSIEPARIAGPWRDRELDHHAVLL
jgi:hypothetical protein